METLLAKGLRMQDSMGPLSDRVADLPMTTPVLPVVLEGESGPEYLLGFDNFHALSRYNPRTHYVMAVIALGDAVYKEIERRRTTASTTPTSAQ
jgi:membrane-bound lytic murein transglycosylase B